MACHRNANRRATPRGDLTGKLTVLCFASALAVCITAHAQEPAPETSTTSPPPSNWGGAEGSSETSAEPTYAQEASDGEPGQGGIRDLGLHDRPQMISVFTGLNYGHFAGYGFPMLIGGRYSIPIVPDGFLPSINDEFGLEFGADFDVTFLSNIYTDSVLLGFGIPAEAMWDFHFSPSFDAYGKLGFVFGSVFNSGYDGFWWTFRSAVGMRLKLNDMMYFRAEVGYPAVLVGLGFAI